MQYAYSKHILTRLRETGALDEGRLHDVRRHWRRSGLPLVHSLVELGHLTEERALAILIELTGLPVVSLEAADVDDALLAKLPLALLRRAGAVPLGVDEAGRVRVATCAPFDVLGVDEMQAYLRRPLTLVLARWSEVRAVLDLAQSTQSKIAECVVGELVQAGVVSGRMLRDDILAGEDVDEGGDSAAPSSHRAAAAGSGEPGHGSPSAAAGGREGDDDDGRSEDASSSPLIRLADLILSDALQQGASDIHLEPSSREIRLRFRVQGMLRTVRRLPRAIASALISRFKIMSRLDVTIRRRPQDGTLWFRSDADQRVIDVRVSTLPTVEGEKVVMRLLDPRSLDRPLSELLDPADLPRFLSLVERPQGLALVTGPTGSGKTTTLYAALRHLLTPDLNFVSIEQPVEYHIEGVAQVHVRPEDATTFAGTLRSVLRQDPNVILVGEIRDGETATTALQAASTGHLVLSTVHTNDAASAATRLMDLGGAPYLLADALNGVLAQRLVRRLCAACRRPRAAAEADVERVGARARGATLHDPAGCPACHETGFAGRLAVHEIAPASAATRSLILKSSGDGPIREALRLSGVRSMFSAGLDHVVAGRTSLAELLKRVPRDEAELSLGCPACGALGRPGARFCVGCGRASGDRCAGCGHALEPHWRHCEACGRARVTSATTA